MKLTTSILLLAGALLTGCRTSEKDLSVMSPDGRVKFEAQVGADSVLRYSVSYDGKEMISPSRLGLVRKGVDLGKGLKLKKSESRQIDDSYTLKSGKRLEACDRCEETTYTFTASDGSDFDLIVRVYDDGAAFRYRLRGSDRVKS